MQFQLVKHFQNLNCNFTPIEQITKTVTNSKQLRLLLKKRENLTLDPDGLNQQLNRI